MSFTLAVNNIDESTEDGQNCNKITSILTTKQYQIILAKHHQNFYDQSSSHFIIIESKSNPTQGNKQLRIRRVFPFITTTEKQNENENPERQKLSNQEIECTIAQNQPIDFERIIAGNFIYGNAIIVLKDPFELYFMTKKSPNPIKLILQNQYSLTSILTTFSFESHDEQKKKEPYLLTVYGLDAQTQTNKMITVNLMTFDIRDMTQSKDYSPNPRTNHFTMFHDDRLYVFGGQLLSKKQDEQLLWSFDTEKGYWFALEMKLDAQNRIFQKYRAVVYDSGKVILLKEGEFYLLQIYQSKISKLEVSGDLKSIIENNQVQGMVNFQKRIYLYTKNSLLNQSLTLEKAPKATQKTFAKKEQN